ncbi:MAG: UPF0182 family protein [Bryobacterales bacterium]|nr:UPF0182 family protein [Bryobacterales bacterium]
MSRYEPPTEVRPSLPATIVILLIGGIFVLRWLCTYVIEYQWWQELGQVETWLARLLYNIAPMTLSAVIAFATLWMAHARGMKFAGISLRHHPDYAKLSTLVLLGLGILLTLASVDTWAILRYFGSRNLPESATAWVDPAFGLPLSFYFFDLPFFGTLRQYLVALAVVGSLVYWLTARGWQLRHRLFDPEAMADFTPWMLRLEGAWESRFLRAMVALLLVSIGVGFFLGRYEMVLNEHRFMVGMDYADAKVALPMRWLLVVAAGLGAIGVLAGRWMVALLVPAAMILSAVVPSAFSRLYVRPNEITLERPYVEQHIQATRQAYGLAEKVREMTFQPRPGRRINIEHNRELLDNVRLWDWRPFHDTVMQIQALRPYYTFFDSDVDRYRIDGQLRQFLLSPRELDIRQLPDAYSRWINPHFIYTHGYGMVLAEVAKIERDGLPVLLIKDAPPTVSVPGIELNRPEIYYGEVVHEPVFVNTSEPEFNYPSGDANVFSRYEGKGGFPVTSLPMRAAAAITQGDYNIVLTSMFTENSRMMIRRDVRKRLEALADFITWDPDPYMVITEAGRLVWILDGYTTSDAHPFSRTIRFQPTGPINYIRNSVKATVDAYEGNVNIYIFDTSDPIILSWAKLFPKLFSDEADMPADLREHARYPEALFRVQTEIYRTFHMTNAQAFYNQEDVWDIARSTADQGGQTRSVNPVYIIATVPGEEKPEFLMVLPYTPRNKDNLISLMLARCDGDKLGEIIVLELSKQELIFGPMQISARINQDSTISKDLNLWNQQGSRVIRGQTLILPIEDTFLYVQPIYLQSTEARMPQLKKVVLAEGNSMVYADTYEQALVALNEGVVMPLDSEGVEITQVDTPGTPAPAASPPRADQRIDRVRNHMRRYRELSAEGKWAEAGRELEAVESALRDR